MSYFVLFLLAVHGRKQKQILSLFSIMDELQSILKGTSVSTDDVVIDLVVKEGMLQ